jgi:hypothetical protein
MSVPSRVEIRRRLRAFDLLPPSPAKSPAAGWIAHELLAAWPRRSAPVVVHVLRRATTRDAEWAHVHEQVELAAVELCAYGIPVTAELAALDVAVFVTDAQEKLFDTPGTTA